MKKNLILLTILICCVTQIVEAQVKVTDFTEAELKGPVRKVIEYIYSGGQDVDTLVTSRKSIKDFDENGNQLDEFIYGKNGDLESKFLFQYPDNRTIVKNQYGPDTKLFCTYTFRYDEKGTEIEFDTYSKYDPRIKVDAKIIYIYDGNHHRIEEDTYIGGKDLTQRVVFFYNEKNQMTESDGVMFFYKSIKNDKTIYKYDPSGNQKKYETYDSNDKLTGSVEISFGNIDEHDNWLIETSESNGHGTSQGNYVFKTIMKRYITYF